jgi:Putative addiction module component
LGSVERCRPACCAGKVRDVTDAAEALLEQALTLPAADRVLLASGLLASLDSETLDEVEVERLWSAETDRRASQLESGEAELVTWEHLVQRIDERRS